MKKEEEKDYDLTQLGDAAAIPLRALEGLNEAGKETAAEASESEDGDAHAAKAEGGNSAAESEGGEIPAAEEGEDSAAEEASGDSTAEAGGGETSAEEAEGMALRLVKAAMGILTGEVSSDEVADLMEAARAREAIAEAYAAGEIAGRNAAIEERYVEPEEIVPDLCGSPISASRRPGNSIFDLAAEARV